MNNWVRFMCYFTFLFTPVVADCLLVFVQIFAFIGFYFVYFNYLLYAY